MIQMIDQVLFELINMSCHNAVFNFIMPIFSQVWLMWVGALLCVVVYAVHCWRCSLEPVGRVVMLVLLMSLSVGVTDFSTSVLKHSIGRDRPCEEVIGANHYNIATQQWEIVTERTAADAPCGGLYGCGRGTFPAVLPFQPVGLPSADKRGLRTSVCGEELSIRHRHRMGHRIGFGHCCVVGVPPCLCPLLLTS